VSRSLQRARCHPGRLGSSFQVSQGRQE
jgi:hypothetical protein